MLATIRTLLPLSLADIVSAVAPTVLDQLEELRVRDNKPLEINYAGRYSFVKPDGTLTNMEREAYFPNKDDCMRLLDILTNHSLYSFEEELRRGYITVRGGHRVGIVGRAILEGGKVKLLKDIAGFNIRVARELKGSAESILPYLMDFDGRTIHDTLIVSPPQKGKTTFIRDLMRLLSEGAWPASMWRSKGWRGLKIGIIDERSEIAACVNGSPTFDVGPRTDVLDACPKAEGMMMMIRSMSPQVLAVDEIGREEDAQALHEALHAGIRVVATAHGKDLDELKKRPTMKALIEEEFFNRYVVLDEAAGIRSQTVYDGRGSMLEAASLKAGSYRS